MPNKSRFFYLWVPSCRPLLQVLREFCNGVFGAGDAALNGSKPFCSNPHNETGLPTGDDFNHAVFRMVAAGDGMVRFLNIQNVSIYAGTTDLSVEEYP